MSLQSVMELVFTHKRPFNGNGIWLPSNSLKRLGNSKEQ
ncbi:hypothetical protein N646_1348 [Vibrio alginolyticus NBRC 15630 = ATCC 17749]|uniref:Uncharacterized protein n=1 Tax=Vibrio alginolyticus (strain ATCC 17749 / DSM 2171 / NBRC 15630 / NCIMB 1903 / NCTC 12160 / XII-53) TaxID=1219076 RepID=A0A2I3C871_VIBAX|nr:hypothetical protein N646_1348 [Vibrio alginolyticus NBRC 15630 = ATCC 17749]